jgi:transposase
LSRGSVSDLVGVMVDGHPVALRERVVAAYEAGKGTYRELAELFGVGEASVKRWVWLKRKFGHVSPKAAGGGRRSTITLQDIEHGLVARPDATAHELTVEINRPRARRERIHVSSTKRALARHGFVVKKSADGHWRVSEQTSRSSARTSR